MLGVEMSDGSRNVSLGGVPAYPPQTIITPPGNVDYNNGCYGNSNNVNNNNNDDVNNGFSHHDNKGTLCDVIGSRTDTFQPEEHLQQLQEPKTELEPGLCAACGGKIVDRYYLLAVDRKWHISCLRCAECKLPLDSEVTCFAKDGNIYCKEDYYRLFGLKRCARCQMSIASHELVMKARDLVYHLNCFTCATCSKVLTTGEHFGMQDTMVYCRTHYEMLLHGEFSPPHIALFTETSSQGHVTGPVTYYNGVGAVQKGRPRKRKSPLPEMDYHGHHLGIGVDEMMHMDGMGMQTPRQKRMRTSFKHHQLRIMKSYFTLNHNPDAKDLKQLAQKTGLNKRVLQVWFQNARAKYRRNVLKSEGGDGKIVTGSQDGSQSAGEDSKPLRSSGSGMSDLSGARSPALSDISSSASMSDFHGNAVMDDMENDQGMSAHVTMSAGLMSEQKMNAHAQVSSGLMSELFGDSGTNIIMHNQ